MNAAAILTALREQGVTPTLTDDGNLMFHRGRLTEEQRQAIRASKLEIVRMLRQEAANDAKPDLTAYYLHHFGCAKCIAGGKGYGSRCTTGLRLWDLKP
ncbi:MAG: hypothetical protein AB7E59_04295 [Pusillimonas sp.]